MNLFRAQDASILKNLFLLDRQRGGNLGVLPRILLILAGNELLNLLGDADRTPIVPAHRAELRINIEIFIMKRASGIGIE